ncbi:MAG: hypothetical protein JWL81_3343 [Verrucomicrobiales bacterium]|nr:hypothetical protein [Verrucomicrobiales bacterium]
MLNDLDEAAPPPHFWSWKKVIFWPLGALVAVIVGLWAYDEKLEPYDDLQPLEAADQDPSRNGYYFLKARWEILPEIKQEDKNRLADMLSGKTSWDPALVDALRKGRETVLADVKEALKRPDFKSPAIMAFDDPELSRVSEMVKPMRLFAMEIQAAVHAGDMEKAMEIWEDMHALSTRCIGGSQSLMALLVGTSMQSLILAKTNDMLATGKLTESQVDRLDAALRTDLRHAEVWRRIMRGEAVFSRSLIEVIASGRTDAAFPRHYKYARLLLKKNKTLNRSNEKHRFLAQQGFTTYPDIQSAKAARYLSGDVEAPKWARYADINYVGTSLSRDDDGSFQQVLSSLRIKMLFEPRALRVKIAILRWQQTHPGQWPATLRELVPDFLTEVPEDPFNGRELQWDPGKKIIFSVGSDWLANDPKFKDAFAWSATDHASPGLRMERPPAPPP